MPDPPGTGPEGSCLVLGYHVLGPRSGVFYSYAGLDQPPQAVHPLRGPHPGGSGTLRPDLLASSESPFPEAAFYRLAPPSEVPQDGGLQGQTTATPFWQVACRHTRIYCLVEGGQLWAYDTRTLNHPPSWTFPKVEGADAETQLQVGETLVYCLTRVQGSATLQCFGLGTGERLVRLSLPLADSQVLIAGGEVLVVGTNGAHTQRVERYSLDRFTDPTPPGQPDGHWEIPLPGGQATSSPSPVRLGDDFLLVAPDGKIQRWGQDPTEPLQVVWPNPQGARPWPHPIPLGPREIAFACETDSAEFSLVRLQAGPDGRSFLKSVLPLPSLQGSRARAVTAFGGHLFLCTQPPGSPICLHSVALARAEEGAVEAVQFATLDGTHEAQVAGMQALPVRGELRLLLDYSPEPQALHREFYLVHTITGHRTRLDWAPLKNARTRVVWESGRCWRVDLSKGQIQVFP